MAIYKLCNLYSLYQSIGNRGRAAACLSLEILAVTHVALSDTEDILSLLAVRPVREVIDEAVILVYHIAVTLSLLLFNRERSNLIA